MTVKTGTYTLPVLLAAVVITVVVWVSAQDAPDAPDPLRDLAAEFLLSLIHI